VLVVRAATERTKDDYGERSRGAKRAESLPAAAGLTAAGYGAWKGLKGIKALRRFARRATGLVEFARERASAGDIARSAAEIGGGSLVSGALLAGAAVGLRRRATLRKVAKAAAIGGGVTGGVAAVGGGVGTAALGKPGATDPTAMTKRAALGGGIAGAAGGTAAGLLAVRSRRGRAIVARAARRWRPAQWIHRGGMPAAVGVGAIGGGAAGAAHATDEGIQSDALRNIRRQVRMSEGTQGTHGTQETRLMRRLRERREVLELATVRLRARVREVRFGGRDQILDEHGRYGDPLVAASGFKDAYTRRTFIDREGKRRSALEKVPGGLLPTHAQVIRGAYNESRDIRKYGTRGVGLLRDSVDAVTGKPRRVDASGRPRKREWEKSWFKNAAVQAGITAGLVGGAMYLRKSPAARQRLSGAVRGAKRGVNRVLPDFFPSRDLSARGRVVELGVRTMKSGPLAGLVVRWGKDLPSSRGFLKLPHGSTAGDYRGVMQIVDPETKAVMTVQRGRDKLATEPGRWWQKKRAYIANVRVPAKHRKTMAGGRALQKMTGGLFAHYDRRGISATTIAGAYERKLPGDRIADTHALVSGYQKRGFRIDARGDALSNEWNVQMTRSPGARKVRPISRPKFDRYMQAQRENVRGTAREQLREVKGPVGRGAAVAAAGTVPLAGAGVARRSEDERVSGAGRAAMLPAAVAAGVAAGAGARRIRRGLGEGGAKRLAAHGAAWVNVARLDAGKRLTLGKSRVGRWVGRHVLRGLV